MARPGAHVAAGEVAEELSELFRASLADSAGAAPGPRRSNSPKGYLRIGSLRLGERLQVEWAVARIPRAARLPPLTLQPLVENAIYHDIEPLSLRAGFCV
ncbi:MAG: hypothetical protein GKR94_24430 [Gammaproteobacteria bacterium]|nr:hypothetical protein [Gammaproteobacteria bacterium]